MKKKVRIIEVSQDEEDSLEEDFNKLFGEEEPEEENVPNEEENQKQEPEERPIPGSGEDALNQEEERGSTKEEEKKQHGNRTSNKKRSGKGGNGKRKRTPDTIDIIKDTCNELSPKECFESLHNLLTGRGTLPEEWTGIKLTIDLVNSIDNLLGELVAEKLANRQIDYKTASYYLGILSDDINTAKPELELADKKYELENKIRTAIEAAVKRFSKKISFSLHKEYSLVVDILGKDNTNISLTDVTEKKQRSSRRRSSSRSTSNTNEESRYFLVTFVNSDIISALTSSSEHPIVTNKLLMTGSEIQYFIYLMNIAGIDVKHGVIYYYYNYDLYSKKDERFILYKALISHNMKKHVEQAINTDLSKERLLTNRLDDPDYMDTYLKNHPLFGNTIFLPSRGTIIDIRDTFNVNLPKFSESIIVNLTPRTLQLIREKDKIATYKKCCEIYKAINRRQLGHSCNKLCPEGICEINGFDLEHKNIVRGINTLIHDSLAKLRAKNPDIIINDKEPSLMYKDDIDPNFYRVTIDKIALLAARTGSSERYIPSITSRERNNNITFTQSNVGAGIEDDTKITLTYNVLPNFNSKDSCNRIKKAIRVLKTTVPEANNIKILKVNETDCGARFSIDTESLDNKEHAIGRILQEYNLYAVSE